MDLQSGQQVAEGGAPVIHGSTLGLDSGSEIKNEEVQTPRVPSDAYIPPKFYGDPAKDEYHTVGAYLWQFEAVARRNGWNAEDKAFHIFSCLRGKAQSVIFKRMEAADAKGMALPYEDILVALGAEFSHPNNADMGDNHTVTKKTGGLKPPTFHGDLGKDEFPTIGAYLRQFEAVARVNGWADMDKANHLLPCLRGSAQRFLFNWLEATEAKGQKMAYPALATALRAEFGAMEQPRLLSQFASFRQGPQEPLDGFIERFQALYDQVRPHVTADQARLRFLAAVGDEQLNFHLYVAQPQTLVDAIEIARRAALGRAMRASQAFPNRSQDATTPSANLNSRPAHDGSGSRPGAEQGGFRPPISSIRCFNCHEMGHYANRCPLPPVDRNKGRGWRPDDRTPPPRAAARQVTADPPRYAYWHNDQWCEMPWGSGNEGGDL